MKVAWLLVAAAFASTASSLGGCTVFDAAVADGQSGGAIGPHPHSGDAGTCVPGGATSCAEIVVSNQQRVYELQSDGKMLYWGVDPSTPTSRDGEIRAVSIDGGDPVTLVSQLRFVTGLAVDEDALYFATASQPCSCDSFGSPSQATGNVAKVGLRGGAPTTLGSGKFPNDLAIDGDAVYWVDGGANTVMRVPKGGGTAATLATTTLPPESIAVAGNQVVWTSNDSNGDSDRWSVSTLAISGAPVSAAQTIVNGQPGYAVALAADSTGIYVALDIGDIVRVTPGGAALETVASSQPDPFDIAVDANAAYWTNSTSSGAGTVMKQGRSGGSPTFLASNQGSPAAIAVDASYVYWSNLMTGTIARSPK